MVKRFESRAQAEKWAALSKRGLSTATRATVDSALDAYELHMAAKGNKPTSIKTTMFRLRGLLEPVYQVDLGILHPVRCRQLYAELIARKQKADTHRNTLAEARTFFRWCQAKGWVSRSPMDDVEPSGSRRAGKAQLRIDESRLLYDALLADMLDPAKRPGAMAVACALVLGMRAGEIVGLTVRDVDDSGHVLWVASEGGKTAAARRRVAVPDKLVPHLVALADTDNRAREELLLGTHWRDWPREVAQRYCDALKLPRVTAHGLRGTQASLAYDAGQAGLAVAAHLGHRSETTTRRHYARKGAAEDASRRKASSVLTERRSESSSKRHPSKPEKKKGRNP